MLEGTAVTKWTSGSLMELPAHKFLDDRGVPYRRLSFPSRYGEGGGQRGPGAGLRRDPDGEDPDIHHPDYAGRRQVGRFGTAEEGAGSRNIKLADPARVKEITGYEVGSIPPFHWQPPGFRSIVDACLMDEEVLGVGAGVWGEEIMITPGDLVAATGAEIADLSGYRRGN